MQELLRVQEKFKWTEITFNLRKNGGYITSSLGSRSFLVVRLAGKNLIGVFNSSSRINNFKN